MNPVSHHIFYNVGHWLFITLEIDCKIKTFSINLYVFLAGVLNPSKPLQNWTILTNFLPNKIFWKNVNFLQKKPVNNKNAHYS